jgi:hypothetical protein
MTQGEIGEVCGKSPGSLFRPFERNNAPRHPLFGPVRHNLPNPSLITERTKTAEMICISYRGFRGEDDFGCLHMKEARSSW